MPAVAWTACPSPSSGRRVAGGGRRPRRAGVSSFGVSGTNAHVVIEQAPDVVGPVVDWVEPTVSTLVVSGKSVARVGSWAAVLADWMEDAGAAESVAAVAHTLNHHRARHNTFATVCAADRAQAIAGLRAVAAGQPGPGVVLPHDGPCGSGTVFVYSGQGSQWPGMGRQLLADEPAFAAAIAELEPDFVAQTGFSLHGVLAAAEPVSGIERVQPVLVGVQLALTALWRSYGVHPDAVIGHSMGEISAAVVAGALTPAQGLQVIATRSRLLARLSGQGAIEVAPHHRIVDPILSELRAALSGLAPQAAHIPILSTVEGVGATPSFDAEHWVANLRNPVRFSRAVAEAAATTPPSSRSALIRC